MRVFSFAAALASLTWASGALAADHPYGMPSAIPAPAYQSPSYYSAVQQASRNEPMEPSYYEGGDEPMAVEDPAEMSGGNCGTNGCGDSPWNEGGCDSSGCCDPCSSSYFDADCCNPWFASVSGLIMTRDRGNKRYFTFEDGNISNQITHSWDDDMDWAGGYELTVGHYFGCECECALAVTYWSLGDMEAGTNTRSTANLLSTPMDVGFVDFDGRAAGTYFDTAREHRIRRESDFDNLEVNLLHIPAARCGDNLQLSMLAGVRYFRFDDGLSFASVSGGNEFGDAGGSEEAYLDVDVDNNLLGFQIGGRADYRLADRFSVFAAPEIGIYGNHIENDVSLRTGDGIRGTATVPGAGSVDFPLSDDKTDVAFLAQIDLGAEFAITRQLKVFGGYRAIAVTGVALADEQVPQFLADTAEWEDVDSNGSLILHGAFGGLEYRF